MRTGVWMGKEARYSWKEGCMRASGGGAQYSTEVTGRNVYVVGGSYWGQTVTIKYFIILSVFPFIRSSGSLKVRDIFPV